MAMLALKPDGRATAAHDPLAARAADVEGTRDDVGSPSLSSSGGSPVVAPDRMVDLARSVEQPFTVGTLIRAAERDGLAVSHVLEWLRDAEHRSVVRDTGARRHSSTALRGARLLSLDDH